MAGIYIHIPFCKQKCTYCDFASFPKEIGRQESYFACLYREMKGRGEQLKDRSFDTVYFGGGTPSVAEPQYIAAALKQARNCFNLSADAEITLEINPATIDEKKYEIYKKAGINRYSIGLQTGYDAELKRLNRIHTAKDFLLACNLLKGERKSADVLLGLHDQTEEQLLKTIDLALAGEVEHVSMYALTPEVGTPIYTDYLNGELPDGDETADLYDAGRKYLRERGFFRYEVSNFAKKGCESRHNYNYWKRGEYIGLGVSASSFIAERRFTNAFTLDEYMNAVILNKFPEISSEQIDPAGAKFETIMLALRTEKGLNIAEFNAKTGGDFFKDYAAALETQKKYLHVSPQNVRIKEEYMYVQNQIILSFMEISDKF
ncbi:MAG: coproporphyrinogen III oxidase [Bacillota bacterium]|nr:MAG: coproporphyrinogen III oxidase [Bacillota bacterium]